jgi:hypothetical protein
MTNVAGRSGWHFGIPIHSLRDWPTGSTVLHSSTPYVTRHQLGSLAILRACVRPSPSVFSSRTQNNAVRSGVVRGWVGVHVTFRALAGEISPGFATAMQAVVSWSCMAKHCIASGARLFSPFDVYTQSFLISPSCLLHIAALAQASRILPAVR